MCTRPGRAGITNLTVLGEENKKNGQQTAQDYTAKWLLLPLPVHSSIQRHCFLAIREKHVLVDSYSTHSKLNFLLGATLFTAWNLALV